MANTSSPITRRVMSYTFELTDFFELYSHVPCHSKFGDSKILHVNALESSVTVQSIRNLEVGSFDVRQVKLRLRDTNSIRPNDIKVINSLALGMPGFSGNTSRRQDKYVSKDNDGNEVTVRFGDIDFNVETKMNGISTDVKNLGFIVAYLVKNGFDLYGLIKKGYAMHTNNIDIAK